RVYPTANFQIHHFDFYRLNEPGIMSEQLAESVSDPDTVVVVEWAEVVKDVLPRNRFSIEFRPTAHSPNEREVIFDYPQPKAKSIAAVETAWQETRP
ncbi:MAG TPA: tRNA (adenosine(37)-N6)-threonylcarbamoyltransferase complex ATPase subunit type 1 TsaE, partial [Candidatus Saccharimonadales bacterium]|nr:tRNA (adenosine(37)-N6)-threonylcarbamoyltransferase complex ATPase subunit type 1 TsaE [Candidatus Saccharimonadales bacterium]